MQQRRRYLAWTAAMSATLLALVAAAFLRGASSVSLPELLTWASGGEVSETAKSILANIRLPRVIAALLVGAGLAVAGAIIQGVLDNPLASPNVIGINSGAGLAVLIAAAIFPAAHWLPPLAAFGGALLTALVVFALSLGSGVSRMTVVLAGIALTTVLGAGMNTVLIVNPDAYVGSAQFLVGGLSGILMRDIPWPAAYIVVGIAAACLLSGKLNILSLGEETAHSLGMNVTLWRLLLLALGAVLAGASVSMAGILGFVGLIVPHIVRFLAGSDNRWLVPLSALFGAGFVVACDMLARTLFAPYELPVGILMSFAGGPFFIYLIIRNRRGGLD